MLKINNPLSFNGQFETVQDYNSSFYRTKIKVFAFGGNNNGSSFTKEGFEKAKQSIKLIPIVAKHNDDPDIYGNKGDLEGHNVSLKRGENGEIGFHYDTYPIGVVSDSANITFEEVNEGDAFSPNYKTYVVIDGVYLWSRYEATLKIKEWIETGIAPKVSMEIGSVQGDFNDQGYFQIDTFEFEAIAALGSDVEPCFPRAEISSYSANNFKDEFKEMLSQLKLEVTGSTYQSQQEGGNDLMEETIQEVVETVEEAEVIESTDNVEETFEVENTEETQEVVEVTETEVKEEKVPEVDYQAKYEEIKAELETVNTEFTSLKEEVETLRQFQSDKLKEERTVQETELFERFTSELSEEEIESVKEISSEFALDQIEEKLFTLVGKKKATFSAQPKKEKTAIKVELEPKMEEEYNPYGNIFSKMEQK